MNDFDKYNLWGIDLGGTKIEGIVLKSFQEPKSLLRLRVPTEAHLGYEHILHQVKILVDQMEAKVGFRPEIIGVGTPGVYIPHQGQMKNCNATVVNGRDLKKDLEKILRMPLVLANDANCFALAETKLGVVADKYPDAEVVFGIILGTGVGGGLVVNGKVIQGKHGIGGEWGHNYLYPGEGKICYCGKQGCNEQILSGPALEAYYTQQSGNQISLQKIYENHLKGTDPIASQTIERLLTGFAKALSVVVNIVDPDVIVMGGGVSNIDSLYTETYGILKEMIFNHEFETPLVKAQLGDSAGVFGAALLANLPNSIKIMHPA
ncbi:hypothetical protein P872_24760 [Rhodonellum psychrophilum GCM71 = DSM 17998]|uniref:ROK family transcriptional regulator n=2 Tax=Rhodonellum TaxID=336827 RepID=U5C6P2_9BACT|nr:MULTISPECIES: ROK family protein [Rhodonellum]ERM84631.1 hypothetical protein P872_24760 [Rhodonellum psychrophilum GCM71 = DSM 17998]SDY87106.1 N-acetylglucosamine kinase [Rhodonellum ikkaensis]